MKPKKLKVVKKTKKPKVQTVFFQDVADKFEDWSQHITACVPVTEITRSGNTGEIRELILKSLSLEEKKRISFYGPVFDIDMSFRRK